VDLENIGDRWTFVNVLPRSGFIQTVHHGKRTKEEGEKFIKTIKKNSDGEAPLFLSDGWPSYPEMMALHDAQIDFLTGVYNYVDENRAFRECINPNAKRFEVKYKKYSPAMLEGFADHCLTLEELLMWRVPK
jgi:hypothetical protein